MPPLPSSPRPSCLRRACGGACLLRLGICALVLLSMATLLGFTPQSLAPARLGTNVVRAYNTAVRKLEHSSHFPLGSLRQIQRQGAGSAARSSPTSLVRRMAPYVREWSRLAANGSSGSAGAGEEEKEEEETVVLIWETMRTLHPMPPASTGMSPSTRGSHAARPAGSHATAPSWPRRTRSSSRTRPWHPRTCRRAAVRVLVRMRWRNKQGRSNQGHLAYD